MAHVRSVRMAKRASDLEQCLPDSSEAAADLPDPYFLEGWRLITGEPPAILLDSRAEMLALLVESTPEVPLKPSLPAPDGPDVAPDLRSNLDQ